jgi:5-methylcytosine-specific restriction protein A
MPILPKSRKQPWEPTRPKPVYQAHAERSPLYNTRTWQKVRAAQLAREPLCAACMKQGVMTAATVCDHIVAVRDGADFYAPGNYQSLCAPCHHRKSAREGHQRRKQSNP